MPALDFVYNSGASWTDLLGTVKYSYTDHPVERLTTAERLSEWLTAVGFPPPAPPTLDDVEWVRQLRTALASVARGRLGMPQAANAPDAETASAALRRAAATGIDGLLDSAVSQETTSRAVPIRSAFGGIVTSALTDLASRPQDFGWCADDDCRKIFFDPAHARKACSSTCSTRMRVRAYRHRAGE
ncbi:hypothetical protein GCM10028798_10570 [Humibacter antri]